MFRQTLFLIIPALALVIIANALLYGAHAGSPDGNAIFRAHLRNIGHAIHMNIPKPERVFPTVLEPEADTDTMIVIEVQEDKTTDFENTDKPD
ncbi:MAG: hypothetical protein U9N14_06690 [Pseudomonadota bacterium]|nr:hypothetical protein [Pseudomonadota bacterium]